MRIALTAHAHENGFIYLAISSVFFQFGYLVAITQVKLWVKLECWSSFQNSNSHWCLLINEEGDQLVAQRFFVIEVLAIS